MSVYEFWQLLIQATIAASLVCCIAPAAVIGVIIYFVTSKKQRKYIELALEEYADPDDN
jgi:hypothetical protein